MENTSYVRKSTLALMCALGFTVLPAIASASAPPGSSMNNAVERGKGFVNGKPCEGRRVDVWVNNEANATHFWRLHYPGGYVDATTAPHERKMIYQHCYASHREPYGKDIHFKMSNRQNGHGSAAAVDLEVHPTSAHKGVWFTKCVHQQGPLRVSCGPHAKQPYDVILVTAPAAGAKAEKDD